MICMLWETPQTVVAVIVSDVIIEKGRSQRQVTEEGDSLKNYTQVNETQEGKTWRKRSAIVCFLQTKPRCQSMKSLPWKPKRALCCEPSFASSADFLVWYNWNNAVAFLLPADALHKDTRVRTAETKLPPFWAQLSPASPSDAFYRFTCTLQLQPVANSPRCLRVKRGVKS